MEEHLLMCCTDPQLNLANAINKRDINAFREALKNSADAEKYNNDTRLSVFEYACQTPGCHEFIAECIYAGCDVNKQNPEIRKHPINFAVESLCYENIAMISSFPTVDLDAKYEDNTPLNKLSNSITDENFHEIYESIKCLIQRGANINITNRRDMAPINTIINNKKLNDKNREYLLDEFLHAGDIDLDTNRNGEARKYFQHHLPHLHLPSIRPVYEKWDFQKLFATLRNERESEFINGLAQFARNNNSEVIESLFRESEGDDTLLIMATKKDLSLAAERMLRMNADVNYSIRHNITPIEAACIYGHWKIVEMFLKSTKINIHTSEPLISIIVKKIGGKVTNKCNYQKCFKLLMNRNGMNIDEEDMFKCSALHYAIKYNNHNAISELLKHGAYIGVKNHFDRFSISDINPNVFKKHLDSCITTNSFRMGDDNFEIIFDYKNLVPPPMKNAIKGETDPNSECADEMAPLEFLSKTKELKHLIQHPLITSFLFLKWHRLAFIFYVNFFLYSIFCISMGSYIWFCYRSEPSRTVEAIMWSISAFLGFCILLRELFQIILSPRIYFTSKENYFEIALIVFASLILSKIDVSEGTRRTFAAITILLLATELVILIGSLPCIIFSTHFVMLQTVTKSFMRSLSLYAFILIAFSMCFYTLLNETRVHKIQNNNNNAKNENAGEAEEDDDDEFNKFTNPVLSMLKTVVMMTGEFDAASINFNLNASSYVIFLIFVFLISTVLFNLLNGLAVSDIQVIKKDSELTNFIYRCQLISRYEKILLGNDCQCILPIMNLFLRSRISLFKSFLPLYKVSVQPNASNQVLIHIPLNKNSEPEEAEPLILRTEAKLLGCSKPCCSAMEQKIVKDSIRLIDRKLYAENDDDERTLILNRLNQIEKSLEKVVEAINQLN